MARLGAHLAEFATRLGAQAKDVDQRVAAVRARRRELFDQP